MFSLSRYTLNVKLTLNPSTHCANTRIYSTTIPFHTDVYCHAQRSLSFSSFDKGMHPARIRRAQVLGGGVSLIPPPVRCLLATKKSALKTLFSSDQTFTRMTACHRCVVSPAICSLISRPGRTQLERYFTANFTYTIDVEGFGRSTGVTLDHMLETRDETFNKVNVLVKYGMMKMSIGLQK